MTQKRFRKLLMSKGYGRNATNEIVKNTIQSGKPYAETYAEVCKIHTTLENINISFIAEDFKNAIEKIKIAAATFSKAMAAGLSAFNDVMKEGARV